MKRLYFLLLFVGLAFAGIAQQDPLYSQYLNNPLVINPAYTGLTDNLNLSTGFRKQWAGFDGSPTTFNVTGHISLFDNLMGAGLIIVQDKLGTSSTTEVHGTYGYKLRLDNTKLLSMGIQAGMVSFNSNDSDLNPYDKDDPVFSGSTSYTKPSFGFGAMLKTDKFIIGLSVPRLLKARAIYDSLDATLYTQHFYATAAYILFLTDRIRFKPSVMLRGVKGSPLSVDYNMALNIDDKYVAGIFTRNLNTYGLQLSMRITDILRMGYVFEVPTDRSVGAQFTSHEITINVGLAVLGFHDTFISQF